MRTTKELIDDLNRYSQALKVPNTPIDTNKITSVMEESAERLFELDERIAIMTEGRETIV